MLESAQMVIQKIVVLIFLLHITHVSADSWDRDASRSRNGISPYIKPSTSIGAVQSNFTVYSSAMDMLLDGNLKFFCKFSSTTTSNSYLSTEAIYLSSSELICKMPEWGRSFKADLTHLSIWKGASFDSSAEILAIGDPVEIYFSESIISITPETLISPGSLITVIGAGFDASVSYQIVFVPKSQFSATASPSSTQQWTYSFGLNVTNNTFATSKLDWPYGAGDHVVTLFRSLPSVLSTTTYSTALPVPQGRSSTSFQWSAFHWSIVESWHSLDRYFAGYINEEQIVVYGNGFRVSPFNEAPYLCTFKQSYNGVEIQGSTAYYFESVATVTDTTKLACHAPKFEPSEGYNIWSEFIFNIRTNDTIILPDNSDYGTTVKLLQKNLTIFRLLKTPEWSASVIASNMILEEGVECGNLKLVFKADKGMGPLRLTLKYTPLRPKANFDFISSNANWTVNEILRTTDVLPAREYLNSFEGDSFDANGVYYPGPSDTNLDLPLQLPAAKPTKADILTSTILKIPDNTAEPSHMLFSSWTDFDHGNVSGMIEWNVSKGWEGFAYKLCVTAYHAVVPLALRSLDLSNERCFFVVVPKCTKCLTAFDTLDSVSGFYGANWIDLWSSNRQLYKTKSVEVMSDEVFNAPNDRVYIQMDRNVSLKLGQSYRMRPGDTVSSVSLRFGMTIENLLALNPDIFAGNEFSKLDGKRVCVLSSTSKYSACTPVRETPSPIFYEATYRARFYHDFDVKGRPIKTYNDRYPQPPFEFPPRTP